MKSMSKIRDLFETSRRLDRRIEKVISFDSTENDQLKREVTEYIVTDNIARSFDRLLSRFDEGLGGGAHEVGVWVSGFYGSGRARSPSIWAFPWILFAKLTVGHSSSGSKRNSSPRR